VPTGIEPLIALVVKYSDNLRQAGSGQRVQGIEARAGLFDAIFTAGLAAIAAGHEKTPPKRGQFHFEGRMPLTERRAFLVPLRIATQ
jgi:hypothetical protein